MNRLDGRLSRRGPWVTVLAVAVLATCAAAQVDQGGRKVYEEQLRVQLDQQNPEARQLAVDAGGWLSFAFFNYKDAVKERTLRQYQVRPWASINAYGVHKFYVRGVEGYNDWNAHTNPLGGGDGNEGPLLERAWYEFDLGAMLRNAGHSGPGDVRLKVGREFTTIGTGLTLAIPLDMVQSTVTYGPLEWRTLLGKTVTHTANNVDLSPAVTDHQDRCIWGTEVAYNSSHHRPFVYFLSNDDHTQPWPNDLAQGYDYSTRYVGVGSTGSLLLPDLRYQTELAGEWGKTFSRGIPPGGPQDDVCAVALDALLEYLFQAKTHPRVMAEYIFASGDDDRILSSTSTIGGNKPGTTDHAFNAFGFRDTGFALAPAMSNLHMYSTGASFFPLEQYKFFRKMEVGAKVFFYQKARADGAISDPTGSESASWVGWEPDVFVNWRLTSDLYWTIRFGCFQPGSAFEEGSDSPRHFLYTGLSYSF